MIDTLVDRIADQVFGRRIIGGTIDAGQRHAAETDGGDR